MPTTYAAEFGSRSVDSPRVVALRYPVTFARTAHAAAEHVAPGGYGDTFPGTIAPQYQAIFAPFVPSDVRIKRRDGSWLSLGRVPLAGEGIDLAHNVLSVKLDGPTLVKGPEGLKVGTPGVTAGDGIDITAGVASVKLDGASLEVSGAGLKVAGGAGAAVAAASVYRATAQTVTIATERNPRIPAAGR